MVGQRTCEYETVRGDDRVAEGHESSATSRGAKTACSINSNNSSIEFDCSLQKTGNGNLQPEIEINKYSSSKKLLE